MIFEFIFCGRRVITPPDPTWGCRNLLSGGIVTYQYINICVMLLVFGLSMLSLFSCLSNHDPHFHRIKSSAQSQVVRPVQSVGISPSFGWPYSVSRGGLFSTSIFWTRLLSRFSLPIELAPGSWIQSVKHINMPVKCQHVGEMPTYQHIKISTLMYKQINRSTFQHIKIASLYSSLLKNQVVWN